MNAETIIAKLEKEKHTPADGGEYDKGWNEAIQIAQHAIRNGIAIPNAGVLVITLSEPSAVAVAPSAETADQLAGTNALAHTPLPWMVNKYHGIGTGERGTDDIIVTGEGLAMCDHPSAGGNAEFIVRACNSHYELISCLVHVISACEVPGATTTANMEKQIAIARAAIKKAEGK